MAINLAICQVAKTEQEGAWIFRKMFGNYERAERFVKDWFSTGMVENSKVKKMAKKGLDFSKIVG